MDSCGINDVVSWTRWKWKYDEAKPPMHKYARYANRIAHINNMLSKFHYIMTSLAHTQTHGQQHTHQYFSNKTLKEQTPDTATMMASQCVHRRLDLIHTLTQEFRFTKNRIQLLHLSTWQHAMVWSTHATLRHRAKMCMTWWLWDCITHSEDVGKYHNAPSFFPRPTSCLRKWFRCAVTMNWNGAESHVLAL